MLSVDGQGNPIFSVASACDGDDGASDGVVTFRGIPTGDYEVAYSAPFGYISPGFVPVHVTNGQTVTKSVAVQKTGVLTVHVKNDSDQPIAGACFNIYTDVGPSGFGNSFGLWCDGNLNPADGTIVVDGLAPGRYRLWQYGPVLGYVPVPSVPFTMTLADSSVDVVFGVGAEVVVHVVDGRTLRSTAPVSTSSRTTPRWLRSAIRTMARTTEPRRSTAFRQERTTFSNPPARISTRPCPDPPSPRPGARRTPSIW